MKFLDIGEDKIPQIGLGTWLSTPGEVYQAVKDAINLGYRHIDCAEIYGNEAEIGRALSEVIDDGIVKRENLWITSKLWNNSHKANVVPEAIAKTLQNLQLDYLDLYLIHWPVAFKEGINSAKNREDFYTLEEVPLTETWNAMIDLKKKGLVKHIGVSNFKIKNLQLLTDQTGVKPEMNQIEIHPYFPQNEIHNYCRQNEIRLTAYAPLGSGNRPPGRNESAPVLLENEIIADIAQAVGCSPAQVLLAWALDRGTIPIPKSVNKSRIEENLAATEVELSSAHIERINQLEYKIRYIDGSFFTGEDSPYSLEDLWGEGD